MHQVFTSEKHRLSHPFISITTEQQSGERYVNAENLFLRVPLPFEEFMERIGFPAHWWVPARGSNRPTHCAVFVLRAHQGPTWHTIAPVLSSPRVHTQAPNISSKHITKSSVLLFEPLRTDRKHVIIVLFGMRADTQPDITCVNIIGICARL